MSGRATSRLWLVAFVLAVSSMVISGYVGYRYMGLVDCLRAASLADQRRTAAIAAATDRERAADLALLRGEGTKQAAADARSNTDIVRAAYPAPDVKPCR